VSGLTKEGKKRVLESLAAARASIVALKEKLRSAETEAQSEYILQELKSEEAAFRVMREILKSTGDVPSKGEVTSQAKQLVNMVKSSERDRPINKIVDVPPSIVTLVGADADDFEVEDAPLPIPVEFDISTEGVDVERMLADFVYWCEHGIKVPYRPGMNKDFPNGGFGQLILTEGQKSVIAVYIRVLLIEERPLRTQTLKTRQLGNTTLLLAFALWLMMIRSHYHVMIIIDKDAHAATKRMMVVGWIDSLSRAFSVFPGLKSGGKGDKCLILENGSMIFFESAQSPNPGTSEMLHMLIESEKPKWPKGRARQINESVTPGIPLAPFTAHIDESTAKGQEAFYRKWKRFESHPSDDMIQIFLPWYISDEYTLRPTNVNYDEDNNFIYMNGNSELSDYDDDAETEISEEEYSKKYGLSHGQTLWRRVKILGQFEGQRAGFDQEYPTTPDHAYRATQIAFFSTKMIGIARKEETPLTRYSIRDVRRYADTTRVCQYTEVYPEVEPDNKGNLFIREHPVSGVTYFVGCDIAEGKVVVDESGNDDPDYTVFCVKREDGVTVAMYIDRVRPEESWLILLLIGLYYNNAWVNGERNNCGATLLAFFWLTGYRYIVIDLQPASRPPKDRAWIVVGANRDHLLRLLRRSYRDNPDRIMKFSNNKENPVAQMASFIERTDGSKAGRPEAAPGCHDDIIFAEANCEAGRVMIVGEANAYRKEKVEAPTVIVVDNTGLLNNDNCFGLDEDFLSDSVPQYMEFEI
jgi:hypothetical protein